MNGSGREPTSYGRAAKAVQGSVRKIPLIADCVRYDEVQIESTTRRTIRRNPAITIKKASTHPTAKTFSRNVGGNIRMYPTSFTNAAKLETQNGMRYRRKICQRSSSIVPREADRVLMQSAIPMITLKPIEVSHRLGRGSK